jgi:hypothetical protein
MSHSEPVPTPVAAIAAQAPSTPKDTKKYAADGALDVVKHAWIPSARRPPPSRSVQPTSLEPAVAGRWPGDTPANLRAGPPIDARRNRRRFKGSPQPSRSATTSRRSPFTRTIHSAGVAELADALDSKSSARKGVGVQVPPPVLVVAWSKPLGTKSMRRGCIRSSRPLATLRQWAQQLLDAKRSSHRTTRAEGRGLEPPTGFPAPDFESGRWPIRLPSGLDSHQFIRPSYVGQ